ncbi:MAG TPA: YopJ family acetyltransferase [Burkholderiales bacterium]|nr:YopJ family acetyltransferase [Burkholderiales bacterium]
MEPAEDSLKETIKADFQRRYGEIGGLPWKPLTSDEVNRRFEEFWKKHEGEQDWSSRLRGYFANFAAERRDLFSVRNEFTARYRQIGELPWKKMLQQQIDQYFVQFWKHYDKTKDSSSQLAQYFSDVVIERRHMLPIRNDFTKRYCEIGGWPGEILDQKAIDERFELFWKKYKETKDWNDRLDEHFEAIQNHRQWYAQIKKEFTEWYYAHKMPADDTLSQVEFDSQIDKRFSHFYKSHQDSLNIRGDMQNHFSAVLKWRAEKAAHATAPNSSGSHHIPEAADETAELDIDTLLENVKAYRDELGLLKEENINTAPFFWAQAANRERYLPHMIVAENLRAEKIAELMENDAFKLNLHYFDAPEDFAWALMKPNGNGDFKGVVDAGGHFIYEDVSTRGNRASVVGLEPAHTRIGYGTLKELRSLLGDSADVVHNQSLTALNIQKAAMGCGYGSVSIAVDVGVGPRKAIEALHHKQQHDNAGPIMMYDDPLGMLFDASIYVLGQSAGQATSIINNVKYENRNLAEIPQNKKKETLYTRNMHHRVTQRVVDANSREVIVLNFSSALDDKRLKGLDRLIECLENLKRDHGSQKAGRIFAAYLSKVRLGLQSDWDRHLTQEKVARLVPNWDASQGPAQLQVITPALSEQKLDENERAELIIDILNAIPKWHSPGLRLNSLKLANQFINAPINAAIAPRVIDELPKLMNQLPAFLGAYAAATTATHDATHERWALKELGEALKLNTQLVSSLAAKRDGSHLAWLKHIAKMMAQLDVSSIRLELGKHLIEQVATDCERAPYSAEHAKILLVAVTCVIDGWKSGRNREEDSKALISRVNVLSDLQRKLPGFGPYQGEPNPVTEFGSMLEMAINCGLEGVRREMADGDKWLHITSCVEKLQSTRSNNWFEVNDIFELADEYPPEPPLKSREIIVANYDASRAKPAPKQSPAKESPQQIHERLEKDLTPNQRKYLQRRYRNGYQLIEQPTGTQVFGYRVHKEDAPAKTGYDWSALIQLNVRKQKPLIWVVKDRGLSDENRLKVENATNDKTLITLQARNLKQGHDGPIKSSSLHH